MIKHLAALFSASRTTRVHYNFATHAQTPTKLQKVEEVSVKFNVKNALGQWEQVHAFVGESFLEPLLRMRVKGAYHDGLCIGGDFTYRPHERPHDPFSEGPHCGMCRIVLNGNWFNRILEETDGMNPVEEVLLLKYPDTRQDLRLACCVPVEKWMDGCTFEVYSPPELSELTDLH